MEAEMVEIPRIEFLEGMAVIEHLTLRNADSVELLRKMDAAEVEYLVDSLLSTVAKVAEGAATAQAMMEEFRDEIRSKTRVEFEGFRKELLAAITELMDEGLKGFREDGREISERMEKNSKELRDVIEEKIAERLQAKLDEILLRFSVEEREEEIKDKTTLKGIEFEAAVYRECKSILENTEEVVDFVANKQGVLKRKSGDIVVEHSLHRTGLRPKTVIECKDRDLSSSTVDEILVEVKEALANREADACLYLIKTSEQMPESFRPIKIGTDYIVASLDIDLGILVRIAKLVGGIECRIKRSEAEVDIESTKKELKNIGTFLEDLSEIQRLSQLASQHSLKVSEKASDLKAKIGKSVNKALESLTEGC